MGVHNSNISSRSRSRSNTRGRFDRDGHYNVGTTSKTSMILDSHRSYNTIKEINKHVSEITIINQNDKSNVNATTVGLAQGAILQGVSLPKKDMKILNKLAAGELNKKSIQNL